MAAMMENKPGSNDQVPSYEASMAQGGQATSIHGIENPGFSVQHLPRLSVQHTTGFSGQHTPGLSGQHTYIQMTGVQPSLTRPAPNIVMTEPEPQTRCSLICSTLSAIFCFFACGLAAIGVSWQARLQVLDGKYRHARHSLTISYILNCVAFFFGLIIWGLFIWMFVLISRPINYGYK